MKKKYKTKLVLFDLDGTLIDTAPDFHNAINKILKKYNNRLGGKIVLYKMKEWQSFQLDAIDQIRVMELLFQNFLKKYYV